MRHRQAYVSPLAPIRLDFVHPVLNLEVKDILKNLNVSDMRPVTSLDGEHIHYWGKDALVMGILNVTPDSFSDGGKYDNLSVCNPLCSHL